MTGTTSPLASAYDEQDRTVEVREPGKEHSSKTVYDAVGRVVETETPAGVETQYRYFANGLLAVGHRPTPGDVIRLLQGWSAYRDAGATWTTRRTSSRRMRTTPRACCVR